MGRRLLRYFPSILIFSACPLIAWQTSAPETSPGNISSAIPTAQEIRSTLQELADITGFRIRRQLPFQLVSREQVSQYLEEKIRKTVKSDEIRAEELTLKKFGFVRKDFDLRKTTIDLLTEQAAAFYDYDRKKLYISDWATKNMRDAALIHELAHAIADQNYSISKYLKQGSKNSEEAAAREAVVEGQASWLMLEVAARRAGTTLANPEIAKQYFRETSDEAGEDYPVFDKAPLYLQRTLVFPYDNGTKFQHAVFLHDGVQSFGELFRTPPTSTAQIIHAEQYLEHRAFLSPELPKPLKHTKPFTSGTLGELETSILLEQFVTKEIAGVLSPKLRGASYRIDEAKADKRNTLIYISRWADEETAKAFLVQYGRVLARKWHQYQLLSTAADRLEGSSEDGYFEVSRDGVNVTSREGFPEPFSKPVTVRLNRTERIRNYAERVRDEALFTWNPYCIDWIRGQ